MLDRWEFDATETIGGDDRFHVLAVLAGQIRVAGDPMGEPLMTGQTMLLPASAGERELVAATSSVMLDMYLP